MKELTKRGWITLCTGLLVFGVAISVSLSWTGKLGTINAVVVTQGKGIVIPKFSEMLNDTPDFYVRIKTGTRVVRTKPVQDVPIGNGLTFKIVPEQEFSSIEEVELWDSDVTVDDFLDRASVHGRKVEGKYFNYRFKGPISLVHLSAWILAIFIWGAFLLGSIKIIRAHDFNPGTGGSKPEKG